MYESSLMPADYRVDDVVVYIAHCGYPGCLPETSAAFLSEQDAADYGDESDYPEIDIHVTTVGEIQRMNFGAAPIDDTTCPDGAVSLINEYIF